MSAYLTVGGLLLILGLVFLLVPFESLHKAFRQMRSPVTTKIGGGILTAGGIAMIVLHFVQ